MLPPKMLLNRRHKAILFVTLVISGCSLLLGAEVRETLGLMLLGIALAWAVGSDAASKVYAHLKTASGTVYSWIRTPLAMAFTGAILGAVLLYSRGNPVLVVVFMCAAGIFLAPLTPPPPTNIWLKSLVVLLAVMAFLVGTSLMISTDLISSNRYTERFGQLAVTAVLTFAVGFVWLSKGWSLIERGISAAPATEVVTAAGAPKKVWGQYISLFLGVLVLTLWLSLLAWSASSDWEYAPEKMSNTKGNNLFVQFGFVVLLAAWPYAAWRRILDRESNTELRYMRRHRRTSAVLGMLFVVALSLAITFGVQNGSDRQMTEKIQAIAKGLGSVGTKIGAIKQRELQTTADYIQAYSEIDSLLPEYEAKLKECTDAFQEARQLDESRGIINAQVLYKSHKPEVWKDNFEMLDLMHQIDSLTKQEVQTARNMASIPQRDQPEYWKNEFRPLLVQQDDLGNKLRVVVARIQSPPK